MIPADRALQQTFNLGDSSFRKTEEELDSTNNCYKFSKIVFVGYIVARIRHNVIGRMRLLALEETAHELVYNKPL